jgi:hypothetical protein
MEQQTALLISPHGLTSDEQTVLTQVLDTLATDGMQFELQTDCVQQAHLIVLDDDTDSGRNALLRARAGQVKLVFSNHNRHGKNLISIQKPVNLTSLQSLLLQIVQKMYSQLQLLQSDTVVAEAAPSYTPSTIQGNNNLFCALLEAKEQQQLLRIEIPDNPEIYVNGYSKSFATRIEHSEINNIFKCDFSRIAITSIEEQEFNANTNDLLISALYRLLWISGIYGSSGKLITGHDPDRPVKLRAWPNFTRNDFLPQHLKIAAVLARQPISIAKLVETVGINEKDVVNFYNAAYAVDLIEFCDESTATATPPPSARNNNKHRGILAKLAAHLKIGA